MKVRFWRNIEGAISPVPTALVHTEDIVADLTHLCIQYMQVFIVQANYSILNYENADSGPYVMNRQLPAHTQASTCDPLGVVCVCTKKALSSRIL